MTPRHYQTLIREVVGAAAQVDRALQGSAEAYKQGRAAAPENAHSFAWASLAHTDAVNRLPSHSSVAEIIDNLFAFAGWAVRTFPPRSPEGAGALARLVLGIPPGGAKDSEVPAPSFNPRLVARWEKAVKKGPPRSRPVRKGGVRVVGEADGELEVKRLGIPGVRLEVKCPKCGHAWTEELDGSKGILSNPQVGSPTDIHLYCGACDYEWAVRVLLRMSLELA